ncbi:tetratricopeptide (TPR) repeat protein [Sphingomonas sp. BE123]|uniref:tetratricopeptide repeat protein n=1 Tax=Sphingomonas sp. BE123 TaxID=2817842 RepID=UPI002863FE8E|nr:tetratricopeptide repeat protein [Sphingomonas sp. BE123]MDR6851598.1 tetratricopeptide (TPR) repeat protein [Sphingomonas sp. BE123]
MPALTRPALMVLALAIATPAAAQTLDQMPLPDGFQAAIEKGDLAHAQALIAPATDACIAADPSAARCIDLLNWLASVGQRREDRPLQLRAARLAAAAASHYAPGTAYEYYALFNLSGGLDHSGTPLEAEAPARRALAIAERLWPEPSDNVALICRALAITLTALAKHAEAATLMRRAVAIRTAQSGADSLAALDAARVLGVTLGAGGRIGDAVALLTRTADTLAARHPDQHAARARAEGDLAVALNDAGRYTEAAQRYAVAIALWEQVGETGESLVTALNNAARNFVAMGDYVRAEQIDRAVLRIKTLQLGPDDPALARSYGNLGVVLEAQGKVDEARPLLRKALAMAIAAYGPDHVRTAPFRGYLADALPLAEQEGERRALLAIYRTQLGPGHPDTLNALAQLAHLLTARGRHGEAEALLREIVAQGERTWGPDNVNFADSLIALALSLARQLRPGTLAEMRALIARGWAIQRAALGPEHPDTIESAIYLAQMSDDTRARTLSRSAQAGILARISRARAFDPAAQAELRGFAPLFAQAVQISWRLARARSDAAAK